MPDSASDYYETPALETLAEEGMRFTNAYAPAAICAPTRAGLHTGKSPAALHYTRNAEPAPPLPTGEMTLPQAIKAASPAYVTGHFGKWHLGAGRIGNAGYDVHDNGDYWPSSGHDPLTNPKDTFGISDRAEDFIRNEHAAGNPFFALIAYHARPTTSLLHLPRRTCGKAAFKCLLSCASRGSRVAR